MKMTLEEIYNKMCTDYQKYIDKLLEENEVNDDELESYFIEKAIAEDINNG